MSILRAAKKLRDNESYGWSSFFEENWDLLEQVQTVIDRKGGDFYPRANEVFNAYKRTRPEDVVVVLIGQDPYHSTNKHDEPTAMGLSFSVRDGSKIAPSLKNIFKVIKKNTGEESICADTGDLTPWAEQGIFLLNACLTVKPGISASHGNIWDGFVKRTLAYIFKVAVFVPINELEESDDEEGSESEEEEKPAVAKKEDKRDFLPITLLWGRHAQDYKNACNGHILMTTHPSPYSAAGGFNDCDHFTKVNRLLKSRGGRPINW
jgi:uracil-DNA glycosylase